MGSSSKGELPIQGPVITGYNIQLTSQATGDIIYFDGTKWARLAIGTSHQILHGGITPSYSSILSTDLPTDIAYLDVIQTWTAQQTFGNNISIGGVQFNISTITTGQFLKYNGTNWINYTRNSTDITNELGYTPANKAGDTFSGLVTENVGRVDSTAAISTLAGAITTTSTTSVSSGLGVTMTTQSTRIKISATIWTANNTLGDGIQLFLYYSTTSIPANGAAPNAGDISPLSTPGFTQEGLAGNEHPLKIDYIITGLTAGTKYFIYIVYKAVTGGTVTIDNAGTTIIGESI